jgi:hypothetical protein
MRVRSSCVMLTLALVCAARGTSAQAARVGAHYGVNLSNGHWEDHRLGAQGALRVIGPVEIAGGISVFTDWPGVTGVSGTAWQGYGTVRARPGGRWAFVSAGYGFVLAHASLQQGTVTISDSQFTDAVVVGLEAPLPYVRPFGDLYLVSILDRESAVGVNLLLGLQVPLGHAGPGRPEGR